MTISTKLVEGIYPPWGEENAILLALLYNHVKFSRRKLDNPRIFAKKLRLKNGLVSKIAYNKRLRRRPPWSLTFSRPLNWPFPMRWKPGAVT
jgi:hypothetical protein